MKLALALEYPLQQRGGVEALVRAMIECLHHRHELHLISPDEPAELGLEHLQPGLRSHFRWHHSSPPGTESQRLVSWAQEHDIELIHFHLGGSYNWNARSWGACPITLTATAGIRCMTTNHQAISPFDANRASEPLLRRLASFVRRWPGKARQLAAVEREWMVSQHDLQIARRSFPGFRPKLGQLYHSLLEETAPPSAVSANHRIILNLATVAFRKGQHILAEAFARIADEFPQWTLQLVGYHSGDGCADAVRDLIQRQGLQHRIHMPGATDNPAAAIAGAAVYVQPSLLEGLGLSLQEAQFHGRACIGSRVGGIPELIADGRSGLLVPPADPGALAQALRRLLNDADLRADMGREGRQHILQSGMTRQGMVARYEAIYAA